MATNLINKNGSLPSNSTASVTDSTADKALQSTYSVVVVLILILNILVFMVFIKMKHTVRKKVPNILLMNQAMVDFFIGITTIPRIVAYSHTVADSVFTAAQFITEYTIFLGVAVLVVCTVERFFSVRFPFVHRNHVTGTKIIAILTIVWIIPLIPGIAQMFYGTTQDKLRYYFIGAAVVLLVGVLIVFTLLALTYRTINQSITNRIKTSASDDVVEIEEKKHRKITRVFLMMSIIYTVTILPLVIGQLVVDSIDVPPDTIGLVKSSLNIFYIVSSMINPLLTLVFKPEYSKSLLAIFGRLSENSNSQAGVSSGDKNIANSVF